MYPDSAQSRPPTFLLVTCEHAGREVPDAYQPLFANASHVLASHRGYDIGALGVALRLASRCSAPLILTTTTRLLVECNRSLDHHQLFSEFTAGLPEEEKGRIVEEYYTPHRTSVERTASAAMRVGMRVLHVGVHSFTDVLDGQVREVDVGLLFDPRRQGEVVLCEAWIEELSRQWSDRRVRRNEPYLGTDDGLIPWLRTRFPAEMYAGVEVEVRQGLIRHADEQRAIGDFLASSLACVIASRGSG